jgi:hypothetical protein
MAIRWIGGASGGGATGATGPTGPTGVTGATGPNSIAIGTTTVTGGTTGRVLYDNAGVAGEYPTSGASSVVLRDSNVNISGNAFFAGTTSTTAAGGTTTLTAASTPVNIVTGSGGQTFILPDATTLPIGVIFSFNNNQSSGAAIIKVNGGGSTVSTVQSGAYSTVVLISNGTATGTWEAHYQAPSNVSWSTNTLDYEIGRAHV